MGVAAGQRPLSDLCCFRLRAHGVNLQVGSQVAICARRAHLRPLFRCAGDPSYARTQSLGGGGSSPRTQDSPSELWLMAHHLWRESERSGTGHPVERRAVHGRRRAPRGATTPLNADLYTALQAEPRGRRRGNNFEDITRLRDGATWQEADAEISRAWSLRTNRYELNDNPGRASDLPFRAAPKGRDGYAASPGFDADVSGRIHPPDRLRQSCRSHSGTHAAAHAGSCNAARPRGLALADSKAALDRKSLIWRS